MCSVALALAGISTGLQMAGQYQQSRAEAAAANAQADAARANANIQAKKGEQIAAQYAQQQSRLNDKRRLVAGQQRAAAGAAGLQGGVGSSLDLLMATDSAYNTDSINLLNNQRNDIFDSNNAIHNYEAQEKNSRQQAKAAIRSGNLAMAGTALTFLGQAYSGGMFKGAGGSAASGTAQTPTTAGYGAIASDTAYGGMSGYAAKTAATPWGTMLKAPKTYDIGYKPKYSFSYWGS